MKQEKNTGLRVVVIHDARGQILSYGVIGKQMAESPFAPVRVGLVARNGERVSEVELKQSDLVEGRVPSDLAKSHRIHGRGNEVRLIRKEHKN